MQLTNDQLQQFRDEGYLAITNFWNEREVKAMQAELEQLKNQGLLRKTVPGENAASYKVNLQLCPMSPHSNFFRAMPFALKVRETMTQLIGDPILLHLDQVFLKPAKHGTGTNWHQDNVYFQIDNPQKGRSVDGSASRHTANGTMRIIPGSFRDQYEHSRDPDPDHHIRCYPPEERAKFIELPAGGALFFA